MRGYFGIGVEQISKSGNVGAVMRTAHAFGASFMFTVNAGLDLRELRSVDTSDAVSHVPLFTFQTVGDLRLPEDCTLVGVELLEDAVDLPSFRHPLRAAYVLGRERGHLSDEIIARCAYTVKIPTRFCLNVGLAAALVMYDRMVSLGRFAERPVRTGGPTRPTMPTDRPPSPYTGSRFDHRDAP